jgi:regulator of cell morphogenesis and NO signaling
MTFCPYHYPGEAAAQVPEAVSMLQPSSVASREPVRTTWADRPLSELTGHIGEAFHEPLLLELPRLRALIASLKRSCDEHCRVPTVVGQELRRFEAGLLARVTAEQDELFPLVGRLDEDGTCHDDSHRLAALRSDAEAFHEEAARTAWLLRTITDGYEPPSNACRTLRALYRGLEELEQLMQLYSQMEGNVLFPRAAKSMSGASTEQRR